MIKPEYLSFLKTLALDWTSRWTGWTQSTPHSRCFPRTLWHTARMASTIANLLALTHHVYIRPQLADALRPEGPLHPRHLSLQFAVSSVRHPSLQLERH